MEEQPSLRLERSVEHAHGTESYSENARRQDEAHPRSEHPQSHIADPRRLEPARTHKADGRRSSSRRAQRMMETLHDEQQPVFYDGSPEERHRTVRCVCRKRTMPEGIDDREQ